MRQETHFQWAMCKYHYFLFHMNDFIFIHQNYNAYIIELGLGLGSLWNFKDVFYIGKTIEISKYFIPFSFAFSLLFFLFWLYFIFSFYSPIPFLVIFT